MSDQLHARWSEDTISSLVKQQRQMSLRKKREEAFLKQRKVATVSEPLAEAAMIDTSPDLALPVSRKEILPIKDNPTIDDEDNESVFIEETRQPSKKRASSSRGRRKSKGFAAQPLIAIPRSPLAELRYRKVSLTSKSS